MQCPCSTSRWMTRDGAPRACIYPRAHDARCLAARAAIRAQCRLTVRMPYLDAIARRTVRPLPASTSRFRCPLSVTGCRRPQVDDARPRDGPRRSSEIDAQDAARRLPGSCPAATSRSRVSRRSSTAATATPYSSSRGPQPMRQATSIIQRRVAVRDALPETGIVEAGSPYEQRRRTGVGDAWRAARRRARTIEGRRIVADRLRR